MKTVFLETCDEKPHAVMLCLISVKNAACSWMILYQCIAIAASSQYGTQGNPWLIQGLVFVTLSGAKSLAAGVETLRFTQGDTPQGAWHGFVKRP
jgi:hypothetical protein